LNGTVNEATQRMIIKVASKENDYSKHCVITSKADTWELLINYFEKHYGNEHTAADNLKQLLLPIVTQWVKMVWD